MSGNIDRSRRHIRALAHAAADMLAADPELRVADAARFVGVGKSTVYMAWNAAHPGHPPRQNVRRPRALAQAAVEIIESDPTVTAAQAARRVGVSEAMVRHRAKVRIALALIESSSAPVAEIARACGVCDETIYAAWKAAHPDRPPRGRRITAAMREAQIEPFAALCDVMADQLTDREQTARAIFAATCANHGDVNERRLWRALRRLVETGRARRIGMRCAGATYTRSKK